MTSEPRQDERSATWAERIAPISSVLEANAPVADQLRYLPDATIDALADAGALSVLIPPENGGLGGGALDLHEAALGIGYSCPSAGWVTVISNGSALLLARFPTAARERVYAGSRGPLPLASIFVSPGGHARPAEDGYRVEGRWPFASNSRHAEWTIVILPILDHAGNQTGTGFALLHRSQYTIEDSWRTIGLRGTGSNTIIASDAWIPPEQLVTSSALLGSTPEDRPDAGRVQRLAPTSTMATSIAAPLLGAALAARDYVEQKTSTGHATYSTYPTRADSPVFRHGLGEVTASLEAARLLLRHSAEIIDSASADRRLLTPSERGVIRSRASKAVEEAVQALTVLTWQHGAASFAESSTLGRLWRDVNTGARHALIGPALGYELAGSTLLGQDAPTDAGI